MNPRRRRGIARAIMAGIPPAELTSEKLVAFLKNEDNNLNIEQSEIDTILTETAHDIIVTDQPVSITSPEMDIPPTSDAFETTSDVPTQSTSQEDTVKAETVDPKTSDVEKTVKLPAGLQMTYSMDNSKTQLTNAAKKLGLKVKPGMNKAKILALIQSV